MNKELSTEMPYFNRDLFMEFDEVIAHINKLVKNNSKVSFIISTYYEIVVTGANRVEYDFDPNRTVSQDILFYNGDTLISKVAFPMGKLYKARNNSPYIEVLQGIDYSKDKYCGDYIRIN